jgi:Flp pilus assembly CpaF family ATPase
VHANTARDALDALVNAALMAGENVTADVVRGVFASAIDLVVHLDRAPGSARRELVEVLAVRPSVGAGFTTEPIFRREDAGGPLRWSGALPAADLVRRIEAAGSADLRDICRSAA